MVKGEPTKETSVVSTVTNIVEDENCGCENSLDGTCTITLIINGETTTYGPFENMSYQACRTLYNTVAAENGFNPMD